MISEDLLASLFAQFSTGHHDGLWRCLPLIGRVGHQDDFGNAGAFEEAWEKRYNNEGHILHNQLVYKQLLSLFDHLGSLPLVVTHAQILNQINDVGKHYDLKHNATGREYYDDFPGKNDSVEPANYKVLLNNFNEKSFYVSEGFGKTNLYITLPPDTNTFVINEKTYPHGATMLQNPKYIVSIFGLLDPIKHTELVKRSVSKYKQYAISFE